MGASSTASDDARSNMGAYPAGHYLYNTNPFIEQGICSRADWFFAEGTGYANTDCANRLIVDLRLAGGGVSDHVDDEAHKQRQDPTTVYLGSLRQGGAADEDEDDMEEDDDYRRKASMS